MNRRTLYSLAAVGVVAVVAGLYFSLSSRPIPQVDLPPDKPVTFDIKPGDHVLGNANAPITIVEYASLTCHFCADFNRGTFPQLRANYIDTGKVRYVYREYQWDEAARTAAALADCMSEDNYFSFIDLLFRNQAEWVKVKGNELDMDAIAEGLVQVGRLAGMDREKVLACCKDANNLAAVDASAKEADSRYGIASTPTIFVNGVKAHIGVWDYPDMDAYLQKTIAGT